MAIQLTNKDFQTMRVYIETLKAQNKFLRETIKKYEMQVKELRRLKNESKNKR